MSDWLPLCTTRTDIIMHLAAADVPVLAAEIGVAEGRHAEQLLRDCPKLTLYMVDPWLHQPPRQWNDGGNKPQPEMDDWFNEAMQRTAPYADRRVVVRKYSFEAAQQFTDRSLDYVYLDGNHAYSAVVADIAAWWPLVRPGGILAGHDYSPNPDKHVLGVIPAVDEFVAREQLQLFRMSAGYDCSWAVRKPMA